MGTEAKVDQNAFRSLTAIVADSPEQIRPCDVDRLLLAARGVFDSVEFYSFIAWLWLKGGRGLHSNIDEWLDEEDASQIEFHEETFTITFRDRAVFNAKLEAMGPSLLLVDVGHADRIISFVGIDTE